MQKLLGNKKAIFLFVFPALLLFTVIVIVPIFFSVYYSMLDWDGIAKGTFVGFNNYIRLFQNNTDGFPRTVLNSFILAILSVGIQLPIALTLALILAREVRGEKIFRTIYFIPVIISTVVIGQLWTRIYNPDYGLLNTVLRGIGLESLAGRWLASTEQALGCVFVVIVWQYIGYHMLIMYASAKSISSEIYESALIDGANELTIAMRISIPLMKPIIRVCVIFAVIGSFKSFDLIYVMTGGGPLHATEVPTILMYTSIFAKYRYGYGSAMAIFIIVECLVFTVAIKKLMSKDVME
ncbi:MAG: sugar ABC transporter permease [Clostridiaceae bacterium]|nr:sugar ABC transporter permease [Clostridiaceae bacterium]